MGRCIFFLAAVFYLTTGNSYSQVRGTVADQATEIPLPGASVSLKSSSRGTVTDINGIFSLEANPEDTIVVSYLGYIPQQIPLGTQTVLRINLVSLDQQLQEVVVTGYTAQSVQSITGSVAVVDVEAARKVPVQSIEQLLQGTASGVSVIQEGVPGGTTMVRIRGFGTLRDNDPLYIIDGTPTKSGLGDINPADVASIQVLKDASAASIYGARAANGVVIVTTRKGSRESKARLSYEGYQGIQVVDERRFPQSLNPIQEAEFYYESQFNARQKFSHSWYVSDSLGPVIPEFLNPKGGFIGQDEVTILGQLGDSTGYTIHNYGIDPSNPQTTRLVRANPAGTDWLDAVFNPARIMNHHLTASGGNESTRFLFSAGYYQQEGVIIHTGYERYSARMNSEFYVHDRVRVGENVTVAYSERKGDRRSQYGAVIASQTMSTVIPLKDEGGRLLGPLENLFIQKDNEARSLRAFGNAFLELDLLKERNLTLKSTIGLGYSATSTTDYSELLNFVGSDFSSQLNESSGYQANWAWTSTAVYRETFGQYHDVQMLIGVEAVENKFRQLGASRNGFFVNDVAFRYLEAGESNPANTGFGSEWGLWSQFGKLDYAYQDKYLASFTLRRDGSSRFGSDHRFGVFPAFSAGWRISEEPFLKDNPLLNDLKLRVGWGESGNQEIGDFTYYGTFAPNIRFNNYDINGANNQVETGNARIQDGNPDVRWETTTTLDVGFDAYLLGRRVEITLDRYQRYTRDMLVQVPQPGLAGLAEAPYLNVGEMENRGLDLSMAYRSDPTKMFTYDLSLNLSHYRNQVISLGDISQTFFPGGAFRGVDSPNRTISGQPIGAFFGYVVDGIYQNPEEVNAHAQQEGKGVGRFRIIDQYADRDGDGILDPPDTVINELDRTFIGSPHPDITWGANLILGYQLGKAGKLELTVSGLGVHGNELFNWIKWYTDFGKFESAQSIRQLDRWSPDNPDAKLPQANADRPDLESQASTYYVEDGSFWRIRNLQLAYDLPPAWLSSLGVAEARIYLQGKNILTFTDYDGVDPEFGLFDQQEKNADLTLGVDAGAYPVPKAFLAGMNITF